MKYQVVARAMGGPTLGVVGSYPHSNSDSLVFSYDILRLPPLMLNICPHSSNFDAYFSNAYILYRNRKKDPSDSGRTKVIWRWHLIFFFFCGQTQRILIQNFSNLQPFPSLSSKKKKPFLLCYASFLHLHGWLMPRIVLRNLSRSILANHSWEQMTKTTYLPL